MVRKSKSQRKTQQRLKQIVRETLNSRPRSYWNRQDFRVGTAQRQKISRSHRREQRNLIENQLNLVNQRFGGDLEELDLIYKPETPKIPELMSIKIDDEVLRQAKSKFVKIIDPIKPNHTKK